VSKLAVTVGSLPVGGGAPVSIQSMCTTDTRNVQATVAQVNALATAGCQVARVAVPDEEAARAIAHIVPQISIPLVADIHFDYRLAILSAESGAHKLRFNPGNIGSDAHVRQLVDSARTHHIPIRVGVNGGSLEKDILHRFGGPTAEAMVQSALGHVRLLEQFGFQDTVVSLKASDVPTTVCAYRQMAGLWQGPLHLGVTEAGHARAGTVKSAIGIGSLLLSGIGDTIRVSLTGDPVEEVLVAKDILSALGLRKEGAEVISCPTCGRSMVDILPIVQAVEARLNGIKTPLVVAVMGCVVNGPGEARHADVGLAGGREVYALFRRGRQIATVSPENAVEALICEINRVLIEKKSDEQVG
jgi:(E)-4-hydroxy-3-methylbut-2-enyl-diphosphate synthase